MRKIMFSHKWGLHQAVIGRVKNTTLRLIPEIADSPDTVHPNRKEK